jgi:phosphate transport system protein
MGSLVQDQVEIAIQALETNNMEIAQLVIERDSKVDKYDVKIDKLCMRLFALQQPVALDLRTIMAALSINKNFERIGDIAGNIAERVLQLKDHPGVVHKTRLGEMGKLATAMVVDALDSFINNDVQLARRVLESDHEVDALDRENFEGLINLMTADRQMVLPCSHLLLVNRNMERLADQATNIAEEVVFLVDAKIVRHREIQSRAASGDGAEAEDSEP